MTKEPKQRHRPGPTPGLELQPWSSHHPHYHRLPRANTRPRTAAGHGGRGWGLTYLPSSWWSLPPSSLGCWRLASPLRDQREERDESQRRDDTRIPTDTRTTTQTSRRPPSPGHLLGTLAQARGPSPSMRTPPTPRHTWNPSPHRTHIGPQSISCLSAQVIFTKSLRSLRRFFLIINF